MNAVRDALVWALAELRGTTRYENEEQRLSCFDRADAALSAPSTTSTAEQVGMTTEGRNAPNPPGEGEAPVAFTVGRATIESVKKCLGVHIALGRRQGVTELGRQVLALAAAIRPTPATPEGPSFLGHLVETGGQTEFVPAGREIVLMRGRGKVTPVYDGPQNVTATPEGLREKAKTPGAAAAFDALDVADRLIERAYGDEIPPEWTKAYRRVAKARAQPQAQGGE